MVTFVWWILSLCGVCQFTWLPVFIDACIALVLSVDFTDEYRVSLLDLSICGGIALFAACKLWSALSVSGWWILLSPLWSLLAFSLPGGLTLTNWLLSHFGLMTPPVWVFITGIIFDGLILMAKIFFSELSFHGKRFRIPGCRKPIVIYRIERIPNAPRS